MAEAEVSTLDLTDPILTNCQMADNQPTNGLKSISVKESPVGGRRIGRSP